MGGSSARLRERYGLAVAVVLSTISALYLLVSTAVTALKGHSGEVGRLGQRRSGEDRGGGAPHIATKVEVLRSALGYSLQDISCGVHNTITQRPYDHFFPFENLNISLPVYSTHNINLLKRFNVAEKYKVEDAPMESDNIFNNKIKNVIIVQHGNLRNGNDYYCNAVNTFVDTVRKRFDVAAVADGSSSSSALINREVQELIDSTLIIVPQILAHGDVCFGLGNEVYNVDTGAADANCGQNMQFVWSSEGWKDGHLSLRPGNRTTAASGAAEEGGGGPPIIPITPHTSRDILVRSSQLYSYDIYNLFVRHFSNLELFPAVTNMTLFGFSAGAQTLLRYAVLPNYLPVLNSNAVVKYVISDPSTFLYFDSRRPQPLSFITNISSILALTRSAVPRSISAFVTDTDVAFTEPSAADLPPAWRQDATGSPWIVDWDADKCADFNKWRYGLEDLQGYYEHHRYKIETSVRQFNERIVYFLVGLRDDLNCRLGTSSPGACDDDELSTHCVAMLQGNNRVDRLLKYYKYLDAYYGRSDSGGRELFLIEDCPHDPLEMLRSLEARCLLFGCL